jgi:hypothetical protein
VKNKLEEGKENEKKDERPQSYVERIAREALALDPSILRVIIVAKDGVVIARVQQEGMDKKLQIPESLKEKSGPTTALSMGLIQDAIDALGGLDYTVSAYKTCKIVAIPIMSASWIIVLVTLRSCEVTFIADKVRSLLGI